MLNVSSTLESSGSAAFMERMHRTSAVMVTEVSPTVRDMGTTTVTATAMALEAGTDDSATFHPQRSPAHYCPVAPLLTKGSANDSVSRFPRPSRTFLTQYINLDSVALSTTAFTLPLSVCILHRRHYLFLRVWLISGTNLLDILPAFS